MLPAHHLLAFGPHTCLASRPQLMPRWPLTQPRCPSPLPCPRRCCTMEPPFSRWTFPLRTAPLASPVPTLQVLKPGIVMVFAKDGTATKYFVQLLAEEVATLDMLDLATAKLNLDKSLSQLAAVPDVTAKVEAQINSPD
ncbi:unnamed protein product [Caretta caretta]